MQARIEALALFPVLALLFVPVDARAAIDLAASAGPPDWSYTLTLSGASSIGPGSYIELTTNTKLVDHVIATPTDWTAEIQPDGVTVRWTPTVTFSAPDAITGFTLSLFNAEDSGGSWRESTTTPAAISTPQAEYLPVPDADPDNELVYKIDVSTKVTTNDRMFLAIRGTVENQDTIEHVALNTPGFSAANSPWNVTITDIDLCPSTGSAPDCLGPEPIVDFDDLIRISLDLEHSVPGGGFPGSPHHVALEILAGDAVPVAAAKWQGHGAASAPGGFGSDDGGGTDHFATASLKYRIVHEVASDIADFVFSVRGSHLESESPIPPDHRFAADAQVSRLFAGTQPVATLSNTGIAQFAPWPGTVRLWVGHVVTSGIPTFIVNPGTVESLTSTPAVDLPARGLVRLCVVDPGCANPNLGISLDGLSTGGDPIGLGIGGLITTNGTVSSVLTRISVQAAPWTIGTAQALTSTVNGAAQPLTRTGFVHGPQSATQLTPSTTLMAMLKLVTPVQVTTSILGVERKHAVFGELTVTFLPEPGRFVLLGAGVVALVAMGRRRPSRSTFKRGLSTMRLELSSGRTIDGPSASQISESIEGLSRDDDGFAILAQDELSYLRTAVGSSGRFVLEYQEGSLETHFRSTEQDLPIDIVIHSFQLYAIGDDSWKGLATFASDDLGRPSATTPGVQPGAEEAGTPEKNRSARWQQMARSLTAKEASGMTTNERLFAVGLIDEYHGCKATRDREGITELLSLVHVPPEVIDSVLAGVFRR